MSFEKEILGKLDNWKDHNYSIDDYVLQKLLNRLKEFYPEKTEKEICEYLINFYGGTVVDALIQCLIDRT
jgi:hypothetical protein